MKNIAVNFEKQTIILTNKFSQRAAIVGTAEYAQLLEVKKEFPTYSVYVKPKQTSSVTIKYGSLKYDDMIARIMKLENVQKRDELMSEFNTLRADGKYVVVRSWFIQTVFPEEEKNESASEESNVA